MLSEPCRLEDSAIGKGSQTTSSTSSTAPNPQAMALYQQILGQAQNVASTPYQAYTGQLTAPVNAQQTAGINNINANANSAQPYINQAAGLATGAANPLTASQIQNYQNPYTQDVVNATQAQFNDQNAQQQAALKGNQISQGALGGNRTGIASSNLAGQQQLSQAPTIANLYAQSYNSGLGTAAQQYQQNPLAAAGSLANFGISGQNAALQGAGQQINAGTLQQQTQQAQDTANYGQYAQAQAYPFQTAQWLASIGTGVAPGLGTTTTGTTTGPPPNQTAQYAGLGLTAASLALSDRRAKRNVHRIGRTNDGQPLFRYQYHGSDQWHIGPIAQEVEKSHPDAVHQGADGYKYVDLKEATDDSVRRASGGFVQPMAVGGTPWSFADGWVPTVSGLGNAAPHASSAPSAQNPQTSSMDLSKIGNIKPSANGIFSPNGMFGSASYGGGNVLSGDEWGGSSSMPAEGLTADDYGPGFAHGGFVRGYADGGSPTDEPSLSERISRIVNSGRDQGHRAFYNETRAGLWNPNTAPEHGSSYGGAGLDLDTRRQLQMHDAQGIEDKVRGYADGGMPTMDDRFAPVVDAIQSGDFDPQGGNATDFKGMPGIAAANHGVVPLPVARADTNAPVPVVADDDDEATPPNAAPTAGVGAPVTPYARDDAKAGFSRPAPDTDSPRGFGLGFLSPNAQTGLLTAGLGMLASRSPFLGNAVGEGALQGLNAYGAANAADTKAKQDALKQRMDEQRVQREADALAETIRHNKASEAKEFKPSWGVVGEAADPDTGLTRKTYGWIDPNKKAITDASGKPITQSTSPTPDKPAPVLDADGKPITGDAALSSMSAQRAAIAKQIGDYKVNPNSLSVRGGHREQAIADATKYNPDYDQRIFSGSNRAMSNFMGGPEGRTIRSLNVAIDHLGTLDEAAKALKNSDYPALNKWINVARQQTGSPVTTNFDSIKQVVSAEIAKAVVGGQTALHDRDDMAQRANAAQSPEQIAGIITEFKKLMAGQMNGLRKQYEVSTRAKNFDDYLEPGTKKELSKFDNVKENYETSGAVEPPKGAVDLLRKNPALATQFNSKYGAGAAERYLGAP